MVRPFTSSYCLQVDDLFCRFHNSSTFRHQNFFSDFVKLAELKVSIKSASGGRTAEALSHPAGVMYIAIDSRYYQRLYINVTQIYKPNRDLTTPKLKKK